MLPAYMDAENLVDIRKILKVVNRDERK